MKLLSNGKVTAFLVSLLCHGVIVSGFASSVSINPHDLMRSSRKIFLDLDLLAPEAKSIPQSTIKKIESKSIAPPKLTTPDPEILRKQAELDKRIEAIRAKLKRTVKKQQLKRVADRELGSQILSLENQGPEWEAYLQKIRSKVLEKWYPKLVNTESVLVKSEARLNFKIFLDGRVDFFEIVDLKGGQNFSRICLDAFREAMPFDPFSNTASERLKRKSFSLTLFFYYQ